MKRLLALSPRTILVITYGGIGDILLTTPLIGSLAAAYPRARIDVYLQRAREGVLEGNPDVGTVFATRRRRGARSYLDFARRFGGRYDLAISVRMSDRQTLFARVAGRRAVGLVPRGGIATAWMRAALSGWASVDDSHVANQILSLADVLGIARRTRCTLPRDPSSAARLDGVLGTAWRQEGFALLHLYPRNPYKQWTLEGWKAVVEMLLCRGLRVIVVGSAEREELAYAETLARSFAADTVISVVGKTSLADVVALQQTCRVYVGLDTGLTHLAAAAAAPTLALYGPPRGRHYFPYHENLLAEGVREIEPGHEASGTVHVLRGACDCATLPSRCERAPGERSDCMRSIAAARVTDLLDRLVAR